MRVALVLGGGAARGAFHLGVIARLEELGVEICAISGVSIGAIVASSVASGLRAREILEIIKTKEFKKAIKFNYFNKSFFKIDKKAKIIKILAPISNLEDMKIPIFITCVDLLSGKKVVFSSGKSIDICLGSSALVPLFPAVSYENFLLADGGFVDNFPIGPLVGLGEKILGIDLYAMSNLEKNTNWGLKRAMRMSLSSCSNSQSHLCDHLIAEPRINKFKLFSFNEFDECFNLGFEAAIGLERDFGLI